MRSFMPVRILHQYYSRDQNKAEEMDGYSMHGEDGKWKLFSEIQRKEALEKAKRRREDNITMDLKINKALKCGLNSSGSSELL
jgi:hypothetical protein